MKKHLKTAASLLCSSALALSMLGTAPLQALADEAGQLEGDAVVTWVYRLSGDYANQTATVIADEAFRHSENGCDAVVLARDDDFRDAMSAAGLAGALNCPILLTARDGLSEAASFEIERLKPELVYVIGGPGAMPGDFEFELDALGVSDVQRVYGDASYDTSVKCAERIAELGGSAYDTAIVAYGQNFQDALSMSSFAYTHKVPIFLQTFGDTSAERGLTDEAVELIEGSFDGRLYVAGGEGAVSSASLSGLSAFASGDFERLWGQDGYETSARIAEYMVENELLEDDTIVVASGALQAKGLDALAGAALAGNRLAPVLLVNGQAGFGAVNMSAVEGFLAKHDVRVAYVLGGAYVMPDETVMGALKPGKVVDRTWPLGSDDPERGLLYSIEGGEATVTGYTGNALFLEIPSTIEGRSVTSIDDWAFGGCDSLESIDIPSSVTSIGSSAFFGCSSLEKIAVADGNPAYKSVDGVLFSADGSELLCCPEGRLDSYDIPSGVTSIGEYAFSGCLSLASVTIPSGVASIGEYAFSGCSSLENVVIPEGVASIGRSVFEGCTSLASVIVPSSVASIGEYAFSGCSSLESVSIPSGVTSIGDSAFSGCSSLASVTVPSSVTSIGLGAFWGMANPSTVYVSTQAQYDLLNGNSTYIFVESTSVVPVS